MHNKIGFVFKYRDNNEHYDLRTFDYDAHIK